MFSELSALLQVKKCRAQFSSGIGPIADQTIMNTFALFDYWYQTYMSGTNLSSSMRSFRKMNESNINSEWHDYDTFIFKCVNEALITENMEHIILLREYIASFHEQIAQVHHHHRHHHHQQYHYTLNSTSRNETQASDSRANTILYHGTRHSTEEIDLLKTHKGKIVSNKLFISASRNIQLAIDAALAEKSQKPDSHPILYEIHINMNSRNNVCADFGIVGRNHTNITILDFGIRFQLKSCEFDNERSVWICCLEVTNEEPQFMKQLEKIPLQDCLVRLRPSGNISARVNHTLGSTARSHSSTTRRHLSEKSYRLPLAYTPIEWAHIIYVKAMIEWQKTGLEKDSKAWIQAIQIYANSEVEYLRDNLNIAYCLNHFGFINHLLSKSSEAIPLLKTSSDICRGQVACDHIIFAKNDQTLGSVFADLHDYKTALMYHKRALNITQVLPLSKQWTTILLLRNMATICKRDKKFTQAHIYHRRATQVYNKYVAFFVDKIRLLEFEEIRVGNTFTSLSQRMTTHISDTICPHAAENQFDYCATHFQVLGKTNDQILSLRPCNGIEDEESEQTLERVMISIKTMNDWIEGRKRNLVYEDYFSKLLMDTVKYQSISFEKLVSECKTITGDDLIMKKYHEVCEENYVEFMKKGLSQNDARAMAFAIAFYTGSTNVSMHKNIADFFKNANGEALRNLKKGKFNSTAIILYYLLKSMAHMKCYWGVSTRAVYLSDETVQKYQVGSIVSWSQFIRSKKGTKPSTAVEKCNTYFIIYSLTGRHIQAYSCFPEDNEVLFLPYSTFLVVDYAKENGTHVIYLRQVELGFCRWTVLWIDDKIFDPMWENKEYLDSASTRSLNKNVHFIPKSSTKTALSFLHSPFGQRLKNRVQFRIVTNLKRNTESTPDNAGVNLVKDIRKMGFQNDCLIFTSDADVSMNRILNDLTNEEQKNVSINSSDSVLRNFIEFN